MFPLNDNNLHFMFQKPCHRLALFFSISVPFAFEQVRVLTKVDEVILTSRGWWWDHVVCTSIYLLLGSGVQQFIYFYWTWYLNFKIRNFSWSISRVIITEIKVMRVTMKLLDEFYSNNPQMHKISIHFKQQITHTCISSSESIIHWNT